MPDVEIVPRRFSDPAKVMSFFTFYVPVVFFREKIPKCTPEVGSRFIPTLPFASYFANIFFYLFISGDLGPLMSIVRESRLLKINIICFGKHFLFVGLRN